MRQMTRSRVVSTAVRGRLPGMTTSDTTGSASSNDFARERDRRILWLLQHHPVTAGMLVEIGYFTSIDRALKRLRRLVQKKQLRLAGTVSLKEGRPEHVYCRGRWAARPDTLLHEVQISRVCFKVHADDVRRG